MLLCLVFAGFLIPNRADTKLTRQQIPTPSWAETNQPRCGLATLSMLAAEVVSTNITPVEWGVKSTNELDSVDTLLSAWTKHTGRVAQVTEMQDKLVLNTPYIWTGKFQGGFHMCVCYIHPKQVELKHSIYNPATGTNYTTYWNYMEFLTNTTAIYKP